jgi:anaerobic selenocysteine-containing dehydrogenase
VRNVAKYSPALFAKPADAKHDHEILMELTRRLRKRPPSAGACVSLAIKDVVADRLGPDGALDWMLKTGRYGVPDEGRWNLLSRLPGFGGMRRLLSARDRRPSGLSLSRLLAEPNGVDLGPLEPALPRRLATRDKRLPLAPAAYVSDLERARDALTRPAPSLALIGRRHVRSNNSWMHNSHRLVKGRPRCTLLIHPSDAAARNVVDGATVRVSSRVGQVDVAAEVTTDIQPGVVSLPHGWGHGRPGVRLSVASAHAGVSINDLVDDQQVDALTGTAVLNGTPVEVAAVPIAPAVEASTA